MRSLRTRNSWPPLRKPHSFYVAHHEKINEDPFAYFISPAEDTFFEPDLAAGIRNDNRRHRRKTRSLSPARSSSRSFRCSAWSHVASSSTPTAKLKRWIERMEKQYFHRGPHHHHNVIPALPPLSESLAPAPAPTSSPPLRGRRSQRTSSTQRVTFPPVRTPPPRRPRSWREPSVDIWPVLEEQEQEEVGLGIIST